MSIRRLHESCRPWAWLIFDVGQKSTAKMFYLPLVALVVISILCRADLRLKSLVVYWAIWSAGFAVVITLGLQPGYFIAFQALLAVAMLIQLRINPQI